MNLYPFEATVARIGVSFEEAVENIDIGGPSLIRAAAKNHRHVAVVTSPDQYPDLIAAVRDQGGTTLADRGRYALAAFRRTADYDAAIARYFGQAEGTPPEPGGGAGDAGVLPPGGAIRFPVSLELHFTLVQPLRYGENPHQQAALYAEPSARGPNVASAALRHGKELSYNNLLDLDQRPAPGSSVPGAGGLHPQAQQSLWRRDRRRPGLGF